MNIRKIKGFVDNVMVVLYASMVDSVLFVGHVEEELFANTILEELIVNIVHPINILYTFKDNDVDIY